MVSAVSQARNADEHTVHGFGEEWQRFDQSGLNDVEATRLYQAYFEPVDLEALPENAVVMDVGCGSGRWAKFVAPKVGTLHCVDAAAAALDVARKNLAEHPNTEFHVGSVDNLPAGDDSLDFLYSLGVLHHVPDTAAAIASCIRKLKPGAPILLYLYYAFDDRPKWFVALWKASDQVRRRVSNAPFATRKRITDVIAVTVYFPLARLAWLAGRLGMNTSSFPLHFYRDKSFYTMRTDALDRFGTSLEHRFTKPQIEAMLHAGGAENVRFGTSEPFWCVSATKAR